MTTVTDDYADLIGTLDLPGKITLLTGATTFTLAPCDAIGLGELRLSDGPTGVRGLKFSGGRTVALLPNATLLASAWSEDAAYEVGRLLAEEAMAQQIHVVLGPTINLHRSPLGGRLFEAYSEDPLLTGRLAAACVRGMQDSGVGACLKHLVANESETDRNTMNSVVDEATLRELYLLPFEIAVSESDPWSMMAAYNDVNGVAATEQQHVNNEVVKGEWGYQGLIMSDWFATRTVAPAANGGLDLVMPGPDGPWGDALVAAVESGEVSEPVIDEHLRRLLRLADRAGALGEPRDYPADLPAPDSPRRREQLTRLAAQGITVLTNRNAGLPLHPGERVALIGRHAIETIDMGGGSAQVNPPYQISVAEGLGLRLPGDVAVVDGVEVRTRPVPARGGFLTNPATGEPGVHVTLLDGAGAVIEERHAPAATTVVGVDDDFDATVSTIRFRARINASGPAELGSMGVGSWHVRANGHEQRHELRVSGSGIGEELLAPPVATGTVEVNGGDVFEAEVLLRPPGRDAAAAGTPAAGVGLYGLIARAAPRDAAEVIAEAAAAAAAADVAVVVVGLTEEQETEAVDKSTLRLPGAQDDLVYAVAAAAKRTVVVVNAATPVLMPWLNEVEAVLWVALPGQEGGHAVAAALTGDIEPAGRLVTTFPAADGQTPAWSVTPVGGDLPYAEGTFIGYRGHFAGHTPAPRFWFGHGLGYATWDYADVGLVAGAPVPTVTVTVTNTGNRPSREVVQVYFEPADPAQPVRLAGWRAVPATPGRRVTVEVPTDPRSLRRWDTANNGWADVGPGRLLVARGLGDIRATVPLTTG
ncbi:glycoside hydrolase family 3 C-terminal domain-containing protein [Dactylosporangium sp. NBC_01737]|uniref:glycoside hydrolase family 3 protein n=1 Tax=Dactylosporangium sp. NBC_01737 TaxID=2975959 RepID=UPI002E13CDDB|nr:glycoside hydrolase family 3 C-terminal domain-containing protein [Dactylosporangium sp. NBC_01737]